jgi:DNA mismatch endonuclease (patch repair protein)
MTDNLTAKQRSRCMSRIRSKNTRPEIIARNTIKKIGIKYHLHAKQMPGKPDIIIPSKKIVLFINGCFWHQHEKCKRRVMPKTNTKYWKSKLGRNVEKQKKDVKALRRLGWKPLIMWECQIKRDNFSEKLAGKLAS